MSQVTLADITLGKVKGERNKKIQEEGKKEIRKKEGRTCDDYAYESNFITYLLIANAITFILTVSQESYE